MFKKNKVTFYGGEPVKVLDYLAYKKFLDDRLVLLCKAEAIIKDARGTGSPEQHRLEGEARLLGVMLSYLAGKEPDEDWVRDLVEDCEALELFNRDNAWQSCVVRCRKCGNTHTEYQTIESSCGGYEDSSYRCKTCKYEWRVDGSDA